MKIELEKRLLELIEERGDSLPGSVLEKELGCTWEAYMPVLKSLEKRKLITISKKKTSSGYTMNIYGIVTPPDVTVTPTWLSELFRMPFSTEEKLLMIFLKHCEMTGFVPSHKIIEAQTGLGTVQLNKALKYLKDELYLSSGIKALANGRSLTEYEVVL